MAVIDLYYVPASPPCRSVLMLARELNLELNLKKLNLQAGDHLKPEFVAINPQHQVPTIVDDGFTLWESRAILQYLSAKHNSELYPIDVKARATVNRLLYFDIGTLNKALADYVFPQLFAKQAADEEKNKSLKQALTFLDGFLSASDYVAGSRLTIADLSILSTVTFLDVIDYDLSEYKNINKWQDKLSAELPYFNEINVEPIQAFKKTVLGK